MTIIYSPGDVVEIGTNISNKIYNRLLITGNFKIKKKVLYSLRGGGVNTKFCETYRVL